LVVRLGRGSGQREDRYMHLLSGPVSIESLPAQSAQRAPSAIAELEARIDALEQVVAELRRKIEG